MQHRLVVGRGVVGREGGLRSGGVEAGGAAAVVENATAAVVPLPLDTPLHVGHGGHVGQHLAHLAVRRRKWLVWGQAASRVLP